MSTQGAWCLGLVENLYHNGARHAVICPGSRSTPLALALAAHPFIQSHVVIDERSAGFFALGIAKADGHPAVVLTTSGTAVANLLPAVVEANHSNTPLIVLSADRPPELRNRGANQTIDQVGIFGNQVRWAVDLPPADPDRLHWLHDLPGGTLRTDPMGPVHLNVQLREPLEPDDEDTAALHACTQATKHEDHPNIGARHTAEFADPSLDWPPGDRGVIVVGPRSGRDDGFVHRVIEFATKFEVPIVADVLSGLRGHSSDVISAQDTFLADPQVRDKLSPQWILQFGRSPTSKTVRQWIAAHPHASRIRIDSTGRGWDDIDTPVDIYVGDDARFLEALSVRSRPTRSDEAAAWYGLWRRIDQAAWDAVERELAGPGRDLEPTIAATLARHPWPTRFLGSSLPVRDGERYIRASSTNWQAFGNRGASGIDGMIATAAGIGIVQPCVAVIGDVAFQHDVGSLALLGQGDTTVVVINNGGGQIFRHLPIKDHARIGDTDHFERLWLTPPTIDIEKASAAQGLHYVRVTPSGLAATFSSEPEDNEQTHTWDIIEVVVDGPASAAFRNHVQVQVAEAVRPLVADWAPRATAQS